MYACGSRKITPNPWGFDFFGVSWRVMTPRTCEVRRAQGGAPKMGVAAASDAQTEDNTREKRMGALKAMGQIARTGALIRICKESWRRHS